MYKVLIVDDEPSACRHIQKIIQQYCTSFTVSGIARNGQDAVELLKECPADVVITDIKMPVMDGIGLASYIVENMLHSHVIIVSGYSDFAYAQSAIRLGVKDYLLKPIMPEDLQELLEKIQLDLKVRLYMECRQLISCLYRGDTVPPSQVERCFPYSGYYMALIRKNGLPYFPAKAPEIEVFSEKEEMVFLYGRDESEALYICPKDFLSKEHFISLILQTFQKSVAPVAYHTLICTHVSIKAADIPEAFSKMYQALNAQLVFGKNQTISVSLHMPLDKQTSWNESELFSSFSKYCEKQELPRVQEELHRIISLCDARSMPMLQLKSILYHACFLLERYHLYHPSKDWIQEQVIEEALFYSENVSQLMKYMDDILFSKYSRAASLKLSPYEYYEKIMDYMQNHYKEAITLQTAGKTLGISRTYLNRLLRKYNDETFTSCLTRIRIEHAKELMQNSGYRLLIKEIAEQVGYEDQFYFSRIFHSYTGISPSDFLASRHLPPV